MLSLAVVTLCMSLSCHAEAGRCSVELCRCRADSTRLCYAFAVWWFAMPPPEPAMPTQSLRIHAMPLRGCPLFFTAITMYRYAMPLPCFASSRLAVAKIRDQCRHYVRPDFACAPLCAPELHLCVVLPCHALTLLIDALTDLAQAALRLALLRRSRASPCSAMALLRYAAEVFRYALRCRRGALSAIQCSALHYLATADLCPAMPSPASSCPSC